VEPNIALLKLDLNMVAHKSLSYRGVRCCEESRFLVSEDVHHYEPLTFKTFLLVLAMPKNAGTVTEKVEVLAAS